MTYKGNFRVGQTFEFVESIGAIGAMLTSFSLPALLARGGLNKDGTMAIWSSNTPPPPKYNHF